jgi:hypothetical protein
MARKDGNDMYNWDISSNAERLVALLLAVTIVAVVLV